MSALIKGIASWKICLPNIWIKRCSILTKKKIGNKLTLSVFFLRASEYLIIHIVLNSYLLWYLLSGNKILCQALQTTSQIPLRLFLACLSLPLTLFFNICINKRSLTRCYTYCFGSLKNLPFGIGLYGNRCCSKNQSYVLWLENFHYFPDII